MIITQLVSHLGAGDAISEQVLIWDEIFKSWGGARKIYAQFIDAKNLSGRAGQFKKNLIIPPDEIIILHLSDYTEIARFVRKLPNKKILVYHNITPTYFFAGQAKEAQANASLGRFFLSKLTPYFDLSLGVSEFNRQELEAIGFQKTRVLPLIFEETKYRVKKEIPRKPPNTVQFLTVGRIAPNKKIEDVIKVFYLYQKFYQPDSRLVIIGKSFKELANYNKFLNDLVKELGLSEKIIFGGILKQAELNYLYADSDFYLTLSEHEGFCLPILEAFYFGLPVLAYKAGGIPETMSGRGILVDHKNLAEIAQLIDYVLKNKDFRDKLILKQKEALKNFSKEKIAPLLKKYLEEINV